MLAAPILADVMPADEAIAGVDDTFRRYWVYGKGRAKWTTWTQLYHHLKKHVDAERAKRIAATWFHLRYGYWPGDHRNEDAEEAHVSTAPGDTTPRVTVREAAFGTSTAGPGRLLCHLIRAGWSLNGNHYGAEVLRQAAEARAFPRGTQAFIDHATETEEAERPAGSVRNLAAVLTEDARWDEAEQALVAEVRLFAPWRETITDMAEAIGLSIRAWVHGDQGEVGGRRGFVVSQIAEGRSVDFVTVPAAGGRIVSVLESVGNRVPTAEARNIGAWLESRLHLALTTYADDMYGDGRLTREERIVLSGAVGDGLAAWSARVEADAPQLFERDLWDYPQPAATPAEEAARAERQAAEVSAEELRTALGHAVSAAHGGDQGYCWVRDFDPDQGVVWFDTNTTDGHQGTWQQAYTTTDTGGVALDGDRTEVTARVVYTPVGAADEPAVEAAEPTPVAAAVAVTEHVTDGTPPTGPNPPIEEEPAMSGTQAGAPPVQAGTPTVPGDGQPPTTTPPAVTAEPAQESATVAALRTVTEQLAAMGRQLAEVTARADQRDADNRRLRNETAAREAVTAAVNAPTVPARWRTQIAPRVTATVLAAVPATADGNLDTAALAEAVTAAVQAEVTHAQTIEAQALDAAGIGTPTGLGAAAQESVVDDGLDAELNALFVGSLGLSEKAATVAVKGRG